MRLLNCGLVTLWLAIGCVLSSCAGHQAALVQKAGAAPFGLKLTPLSDPALGQSAPRLALSLSRGAKELSVTVSGAGLTDVRSVYFELEYDAAQLNPLEVTTLGLADKGQVLALNLLACAGRVRSGQVLLHPQAQRGLSGDAELAVVRFSYAPFQAHPLPRTASTPPGTKASKALLEWNGISSTLSWPYTVSGDYNQDGAVGINDLTPLGIHFDEQGPFQTGSVQTAIDGNSDQKLDVGDLTPIGVNYGCNASAGYAVFESTDPAQYPASNEEAPSFAPLATVPLNAADGSPGTNRLQFTYQVAAPVAQAYYFVRPVDNLGACGSPSYSASGNPALLPSLSIANPPLKGNGSSAFPYWVSGTETYTLQLLVPGIGDASQHTFTKYYISDAAAGTITMSGPTLTIDPEWVGKFSVNASFENTLAVAPVYFYAKPPYSMVHYWADEGTPTSNVVGEYCSLTDIAGQPAVAYYNQTDGTLWYAYYTSAPAGWHPSLVDGASVVGKYCSLLALANGCPAIAYQDQTNQKIKIASATKTTPDGPGDWVVYTACNDQVSPTEFDTHLVNGTMAVVFNRLATNELWYMRTYEDFPDDITDWVWHAVTGAEQQALPSLDWVDGVPAIAYYDAVNMDLRYCYGKSFEPHNSSGWVKMAVDSNDAVGISPQLYAMDGQLPVIAYFDWTNGDLKFAQAQKSKPLSAADWTLTYIDCSADMVGTRISLAVVQDRLCIAYRNYTTEGMLFARNKTPYPKGPQSWQVWNIDSGPDVGDYLSLAEIYGPLNGIPAVTYFNKTDGNLEFAWPK
jgi:hypothetical protein